MKIIHKKNHQWFLVCILIVVTISISIIADKFYISESDEIAVEEHLNETISRNFNNPYKVIPQVPILQHSAEPHREFKKKPAVRKLYRLPTSQISLQDHPLLAATRWKIWANAQTTAKNEVSGSDEILGEVSNQVVVTASSESSTFTRFIVSMPIVVFDPRLQKAGIITGHLKIITEQKEQLEHDLIPLRARIADSFTDIHTYFITSLDPVFDLELLYESLRSKSYIQTIEFDVINRKYEKY